MYNPKVITRKFFHKKNSLKFSQSGYHWQKGYFRPYKRHARILKRLHDAGALPGDIAGLTWYSWKDTGISLHAAKTSPLSTRDQAGHIDFAVTSIYYHAPEQNPEYRNLENDLF